MLSDIWIYQPPIEQSDWSDFTAMVQMLVYGVPFVPTLSIL